MSERRGLRRRDRKAALAGPSTFITIKSNWNGCTWTGDAGTTDLDEIFRLFNRVDDEDAVRLERLGYRLPSLSVKDTITIGTETWEVAPFGFDLLTREETA